MLDPNTLVHLLANLRLTQKIWHAGEAVSRGQVLEDGGGGGGGAVRPLHRAGDRVRVAGGVLRARAQEGEGRVQGVRQEDLQEVGIIIDVNNFGLATVHKGRPQNLGFWAPSLPLSAFLDDLRYLIHARNLPYYYYVCFWAFPLPLPLQT